MTRSRYKTVDDQYPHFITATVNNWLPLFTRPELVNIVFDSWRFLQQDNGFEIFGYVILENHLHLIARSEDLGGDIHRFKAYTAKEIVTCLQSLGANRLLRKFEDFKRPHKTETQYQVWEEGSHPQVIESETVLRQKLDYIRQNPVNRGYVDLAEHWRYSSARDYEGKQGLIEIFRDWWRGGS
jgi:putative transposase